ncbi:MAG: class I SAM-dependent methyltransferase [Oscillospiraceae bacterium]|nr:class I SAM-dependent methyltransferase [Oscillospiraceae bacterium]
MNNPWESINLFDYENHMKLDSVMQLQVLNQMMKNQLDTYSVDNVMILGIAGGNGLEHINREKYSIVYGVDINSQYLREVEKRYKNLDGTLKCLCVDLLTEVSKLPTADFVIANLLIEYIGYDCFKAVVSHVKPKYVSCGIQINSGSEFVSDSPYLHVFDGLNSVHHQMDSDNLTRVMGDVGYKSISTIEYLLPNGKKLVQIDFIDLE